MKKLLIFLLLPIISFGQNNIDPLPIITDTTNNYNISDLPPATYFIRLEAGGEIFTKKFIKE
jgi:hypothetical protein